MNDKNDNSNSSISQACWQAIQDCKKQVSGACLKHAEHVEKMAINGDLDEENILTELATVFIAFDYQQQKDKNTKKSRNA